jgi:hypothetical protein
VPDLLLSEAGSYSIDTYEDPDSLNDDDYTVNISSSTGVRSPVVSEVNAKTEDIQSNFTDSTGRQIDIKTFWPAFLDHLIHERPNMGSFLSLACAFHSGEDTIDLKFSSAYRFQYLEITRNNNRDEIEQHLKKFAGRKLQLNITIESKPIENHQQNFVKAIGNVPSTIDDEIEREPIIKTVLDIFDGEVLD